MPVAHEFLFADSATRPLAWYSYSSESLRRGVHDLFGVLRHDIRVARAGDDDRFDVQILARGPLLPFRPYRVVLFAADIDILDRRQFLERANFRHAGGALRELSHDLRREDFFEIERLLERLAWSRNDGVDHHDPPYRTLGCHERHEQSVVGDADEDDVAFDILQRLNHNFRPVLIRCFRLRRANHLAQTAALFELRYQRPVPRLVRALIAVYRKSNPRWLTRLWQGSLRPLGLSASLGRLPSGYFELDPSLGQFLIFFVRPRATADQQDGADQEL